MNYWLIKSDPESFSWTDMIKDGSTDWDGVRNYQARNNLKEMKKNDKVLFYHSVEDKLVMGIVIVTKEFYQDPTTNDDRWVAVQISKPKSLKNPVSLKAIKANMSLQDIALVKHSRLSVMPLQKDEFEEIVRMGK